MTNIKIYKTDEKLEFDAKGHAGHSFDGSDIVCAAVSTLSQALLHALLDEEGIVVSEYMVNPGRLKFIVKGSGDRLSAMADLAAKGYKVLAKQYPDNVSVHSNI